MKMAQWEKAFVNSRFFTKGTARKSARLLTVAGATAGQHYLDVGCGNGAATVAAAKQFGLRATGIDVDPAQIQVARQGRAGVANMHFEAYAGTYIPFEDEAFDIVASFKVLHHIPTWRQTLNEMIRVLRPSGYLIYFDMATAVMAARAEVKLTGKAVEVATYDLVIEHLANSGLMPIHQSKMMAMVEGVFRK